MISTSSLHWPRGTATSESDLVLVTPQMAGWTYSGLRVIDLAPGETRNIVTGTVEMVVLPLSGSCMVEAEGYRFNLLGRTSVFSSVSDFAYLPIDTEFRLISGNGGQFALPFAEAQRRFEPAYRRAEEVDVEVRGAGRSTRQVTNFFTPHAFQADRLIAVEVLTPEGNSSSYPPHKHDEFNPETGEAAVEEIYYFRFGRQSGYGLYRQYTADGGVDVTCVVGDGDVFLVPAGYHGPSVALPGQEMYFLNVLAGPSPTRTMANSDDPKQAWVKGSWEGQPQDQRVPLTTASGRNSNTP